MSIYLYFIFVFKINCLSWIAWSRKSALYILIHTARRLFKNLWQLHLSIMWVDLFLLNCFLRCWKFSVGKISLYKHFVFCILSILLFEHIFIYFWTFAFSVIASSNTLPIFISLSFLISLKELCKLMIIIFHIYCK